MGIHHRQTCFSHSLCENRLPLRLLAQVIGRCIHNNQHLRTRHFCGLRGLLQPRIFTNQNADLDASYVNQTRLMLRREITQLIKYAVIGKRLLDVAGLNAAITDPACGVLSVQSTGGCLRVPHQQRHARPCCAGVHNRLQRFITGLLKRGAQQQIFGSVATQRQLRRDQQLCALRMSVSCSFNDFLRVTAQIAHQEVELCNTNGCDHEKRGPQGLSAISSC